MLQFFQPAMKQNITLKKIIGKIPPGIINDDLKDNITIESDIRNKFRVVKRDNRRELAKLPLHKIDQDQSRLDLRDHKNQLLIPALKFIKNR